MEIKLGNYELIHSGVVISIKGSQIAIKLPDNIEGDYTFILNFIDDKEKKNSETRFFAIDKHTLQIDFVNFDGFIGGGNADMINVGTLRNFPLFFSYRVFDLISGKTLLFNFYTKKEE